MSPQLSDAKHRDHRIENRDGFAHEHNTVTLRGGRHDHIDTRLGGFRVAHADAMNIPARAIEIHVLSQQADAVIDHRGDVSIHIANNDGNGERFPIHCAVENGKPGNAIRAAEGAADSHIESLKEIKWPDTEEQMVPIDWSPLADRKIIVIPDDDSSN